MRSANRKEISLGVMEEKFQALAIHWQKISRSEEQGGDLEARANWSMCPEEEKH